MHTKLTHARTHDGTRAHTQDIVDGDQLGAKPSRYLFPHLSQILRIVILCTRMLKLMRQGQVALGSSRTSLPNISKRAALAPHLPSVFLYGVRTAGSYLGGSHLTRALILQASVQR